MEFAEACKGLGLRAITGAELTVALDRGSTAAIAVPISPTSPSWSKSAAGYRNLCRLLTAAHSHTRDSTGRSCRAAVGDAGAGRGARRGAGLPLRLRPRRGAGRRLGAGRDRAAASGSAGACSPPSAATASGSSCSGPSGATTAPATAGSPGSPSGSASPASPPATSTPTPAAAPTCRTPSSRCGWAMTLEESEPLRRGNRSSALASPAAMAERFAEHPEAVAETLRLAERLAVRPDGRSSATATRAKASPAPTASWPSSAAALLAERYARARAHRREAESRLDEELATIRHLGLSGFFLLHHDLLELAREVAVEVRGPDSARAVLPPGRGRGSSVSSIVCYLTGLSHIDPVETDLFSGRFLNEEVDESMPDIDLDFPRDIREVLIPRVHERYGADRSALVAAFPTYRPRGVVRDLGKALGLPPEEIEKVAGTVGFHESQRRDRARRRRRDRPRARRLAALAGAARALRRGDGPAPPRLPALRRHGDLDPAADRRLPGRAGGDGGAPDRPVGQGLLRRRRLPQDRPAGAGDALRGRALRRGSGADAGRAARPLADPARRRRDLRVDPRRRDHRRLPDREPGADADAAAHPAARTSTTSPCRWRWSGPARSRAAPSTPI